MDKERAIRVLIVDDEDRFRTTTQATLSRRGFEVDAVGDGEQAVERVEKADYDVVVLDIQMPRKNGHSALREIKRLKPDMQVIMLTAYGSMDSALQALHDEVFAYLAKPCDIDLLALRIREASFRKGALRHQHST
ncbi:MAG: response regulator [Candidatus Abyssubacteria bacterium]